MFLFPCWLCHYYYFWLDDLGWLVISVSFVSFLAQSMFIDFLLSRRMEGLWDWFWDGLDVDLDLDFMTMIPRDTWNGDEKYIHHTFTRNSSVLCFLCWCHGLFPVHFKFVQRSCPADASLRPENAVCTVRA